MPVVSLRPLRRGQVAGGHVSAFVERDSSSVAVQDGCGLCHGLRPWVVGALLFMGGLAMVVWGGVSSGYGDLRALEGVFWICGGLVLWVLAGFTWYFDHKTYHKESFVAMSDVYVRV